VNPTWSRIGR